MAELASQLKVAMHEIYRESRRLRYVPTRFLQMLNEQGALVTVHQLLASDRHHDGFTRLWDLRRLDLSLECVVLKPVFRTLFTEKELNAARCRLRKLDFDPNNCEGGSRRHPINSFPPWVLRSNPSTDAPRAVASPVGRHCAVRGNRGVHDPWQRCAVRPSPLDLLR